MIIPWSSEILKHRNSTLSLISLKTVSTEDWSIVTQAVFLWCLRVLTQKSSVCQSHCGTQLALNEVALLFSIVNVLKGSSECQTVALKSPSNPMARNKQHRLSGLITSAPRVRVLTFLMHFISSRIRTLRNMPPMFTELLIMFYERRKGQKCFGLTSRQMLVFSFHHPHFLVASAVFGSET